MPKVDSIVLVVCELLVDDEHNVEGGGENNDAVPSTDAERAKLTCYQFVTIFIHTKLKSLNSGFIICLHKRNLYLVGNYLILRTKQLRKYEIIIFTQKILRLPEQQLIFFIVQVFTLACYTYLNLRKGDDYTVTQKSCIQETKKLLTNGNADSSTDSKKSCL